MLNIIIHNFDGFILKSLENEREIFYRKLYVLLTRAQKNLYISCDRTTLTNQISKSVIDILDKYKISLNEVIIEEKKEHKLANLSKFKPTKEQVKTTGEFLVLGAELFAVIAGMFS